MLKLFYAQASPFSRKVRIVLAEKMIECQLVEDAPFSLSSPVPQYNPLGKIPVLVLDDGTSLYDSRVIVEYLDNVSPVSRLIPEPSRQRLVVRRWEALADGICDAAVCIVLESRRPAKLQSADQVERQHGKGVAGITEMARELADRAWCTRATSVVSVTNGAMASVHPTKSPRGAGFLLERTGY